ncbi:MAG: integrase [Burkholderiales bacterium]|nr:MAG: integrase [Betaproteobacteria bacterium]TAG84590.1 MAG: integrase [Burkholderiales bacterium]
MYRLRRSYFFRSPVPPRKWIALGRDLNVALAAYAQLLLSSNTERASARETALAVGVIPNHPRKETFADLWKRYQAVVLPTKAIRTQQDNLREAQSLLAVFGAVALDDITPVDIRTYLDTRGATAPVRANREVALLSHAFNRAREWGMLTVPNPCQGVRKFREKGRDRYVADDEYLKVWQEGDMLVKDTMSLAYLLGQRPQDVFKLTLQDVSTNLIDVQVTKTKQRVRIEVTSTLQNLIDDLRTRYRKPHVKALLVNEKGVPATPDMFRNRFDRARDKAGVSFQLRDLRAKNATDTEDLAIAQKRLAHTSRAMTEHYVRSRQGEKVAALDRTPAASGGSK